MCVCVCVCVLCVYMCAAGEAEDLPEEEVLVVVDVNVGILVEGRSLELLRQIHCADVEKEDGCGGRGRWKEPGLNEKVKEGMCAEVLEGVHLSSSQVETAMCACYSHTRIQNTHTHAHTHTHPHTRAT